jgi:two-component SAPR family response regulator
LINTSPVKKKKGLVKLKKIELMWTTREEKETEIYKNQNVYVLAEFLEHVQINKTVVDG